MKLSRKVFAASAMMLIAGFAFAQSEKESSVESEYTACEQCLIHPDTSC